MYTAQIKEQAIALRLAGNSYGTIRRKLKIKSKATLSVWFKELVLTQSARALLEKNNQVAIERGLHHFNAARSAQIQRENELERKRGRAAVRIQSKRDLQLIGAALYWGEGTKAQNANSANSLALANADPSLIKVYLRFVREVLLVPDSLIRAGIHMYEGMNENTARDYWSKCTKLPRDRFFIVIQQSRAGQGKRKTLPYGTLAVRVNKRRLFYYVKGMIDGLAH